MVCRWMDIFQEDPFLARLMLFEELKEAKLCRKPNFDEVFIHTHKNKKGKWVDTNTCSITKELENAELVATQAGKASLNDAERLELWKSIDGVQSQSGKIYGRFAYSDNYVFEYFSKTTSSSKTRSPVEHQMKDLSLKIVGFVGIAKKVDDLIGLKDVVERIFELLSKK
ncbi:hypothetical protein ACFE04_020628 [Oxalis oulophora]